MSQQVQGSEAAGPVDVRGLLDPELAPILGAFEMPTMDAEGVAMIRGTPFPAQEVSDAVVRTEHVAPGHPPVPVRVHRPAGVDGLLPAIFTIHGGGYVIGSYTMDDFLHDAWGPHLGTVGVSVDYRLAPETPVSGPARGLLRRLALDPRTRRGAGDRPDAASASTGSAPGAGWRPALALLARDRGEFPFAFQLLDCPMLDECQATPSLAAEGLYVWTPASNEFGWRSYLGDLYGSDDVPPYAAAARATDLAGLPPTCIVVGSIDGFRDEDVDYALRLNQAGVPCELHVIAGLPHVYRSVARRPGRAAGDPLQGRLAGRQLGRLAR